MKKLNRKGFTLIELLAIIVILAIIMVVTIPTVLNSMSNAKESQLQNAANSVAEWFEKQYSLEKLGSVAGGADAAYTTFGSIPEAYVARTGTNFKACGSATGNAIANGSTFSGNKFLMLDSNCKNGYKENTSFAVKNLTSAILLAAGIADADESINVTSGNSTVYYDQGTGKACVKLTAAAGKTFDNDTEDTKYSSGC